MSELPEVRRADCGHGFLLIDVPPAAVHQNGQHEQPVYLCESCRQGLSAPKVERKDVQPEASVEDWNAAGRRAAEAGQERTLPPELRGDHARSARPRAWFAGFDSAKERS